MALTIGTNCYVSRSAADSYFSDRIQSSSWSTASDTTKDAALITASSMIDNEYQFIGQAISASQGLAWPRGGAWYHEPKTGRQVDTNWQPVPWRVAVAVQELAEHLIRNTLLLADGEQTFERIKVGSIELEDKSPDYKSQPRFPANVRSLLTPLLIIGSTSNTWWRAN